MTTNSQAKIEAQHLISEGLRQVTLATMSAELAQLGYRLDRSMDCASMATNMTGERAGQRYPALALYPKVKDTGLSAWNVDARRDANYKRLQQYRMEVFAIVRNAQGTEQIATI